MSELTYDDAKRIGLEFPEVREGITYGSASLYIGKKFMAVSGADNVLIIKSAIIERDLLIELEPDKFFITDHYRPFDYVLVRLNMVSEDEVRDLFRKAWRMLALKKWLKEHPAI